MNELTILMNLLSSKRDKYQIGAPEKEILNTLNVKDKNKSIYFQNLITNLSNYIEPLGLQVKFNSLNSFWYLSFDSEISEVVAANLFDGKPRLAATLFCTLICCFNNSGKAKIQEIQELRKKKGILEDLRDLEKFGLIFIDKNLNQVVLTPLIGYLLDLEKLFIKIALKQKSEKIKN